MPHARHAQENPDPGQYSDAVYVEEYSQNEAGERRWQSSSTTLSGLCTSANVQQHSIAFLETPPGQFNTSRTALTRDFGIPEDFWEELYQEANGYFGAYETRGNENNLERLDTEFRYLCKCNKKKSKAPLKTTSGINYVWEKMAFFTSWTQEGSCTMLCFDLPDSVRTHIIRRVRQLNVDASPFFFHHLAVAAITCDYEGAVWEWRDLVRDLERLRPDPHDMNAAKPDYIKMHELSRHTTHSTENLASAIETTTTILETVRRLDKAYPSRKWSTLAVDQALVRQNSLLKSLHNRSEALESRLTSEINLVFHINGQQDSKLAAQIARLARDDSEITKTIAVLGLLFLPGTLISAIFSTSFFNFTPASDTAPARWSVSDQFWIFWVVTGVVTVLTLITWVIWRRWPSLKAFYRRLRQPTGDDKTSLPLTEL